MQPVMMQSAPREPGSSTATHSDFLSRIMNTSDSRKRGSRGSRLSHALLGNDSWDLFEGIPKHLPLRVRVRMKLKCSAVGVVWELFQTAFAIIVSALYVQQTYDPAMNTDAFDLAALIVFSSDYLLNFYCCDNRLRFVLTFMSIMDMLTIVPAIVDRITTQRGRSALPFLRFVRVLRLLRLIRLLRAAGSRSISAVHKQIQTIVLLLTSLVFIAAGIFHAVESDYRDPSVPTITFGAALYFILVTLATVGYGDIAPLTSSGRAVAAAVIIVAFTVIPRELSRLNQLMALQSQFRKVYRPVMGNPHILIIGHVAEPRCLLDFFRELYHPDRLLENGVVNSLTELPSVIMGPEEPSEAIVHLLDHPMLQNRVTYIKGSVMSEEDLCRVGTDIARACFVLVSKSSADSDKTDQETVLRLLAVRNYNPELEIYTQIVSPVHSEYISEDDADHVLCLDQIKLSLMAKSTLCPGLVTLISNLFQSSGLSSDGRYKGWEREYIDGLSLEIYATALPPAFSGLSFSQACDVLYRISKGEIILLGVYERGRNARGSRVPSPPSSPVKKRTGPSLPTLKVRPVLKCHSSRYRSVPGSTMAINPGSTMAVGAGQIFYVMSESKKLTQTSSILELLAEWLRAGNTLPLPTTITKTNAHIYPQSSLQQRTPPTAAPAPVQAPAPTHPQAPHSHEAINVRVIRRRQEDVIIQDTSDAKLSTPGVDGLSNHVIIVSDVDHVSMDSFVRMLRLARHKPGSDDYHAVVFLSWSTKNVSMATRVLQEYDDVFLMLATNDSKAELLRADILSAHACVLLADKSAIQQLDDEVIDGKTIFHYLAILSIQDEYDITIASTFVPIVELTVPRTMKILDMEMKKRLKAAIRRQRRLHLSSDDDDGVTDDDGDAISKHARDRGDFVTVIESENDRQRRKLERTSSKNIVKNMYAHGASNISSLESHLKLKQRVQYRRSLIRRQQALTERAYFESGGASVLPFFAAGFGFSVDIFDNILCQSFFTPGLIRFIYELLFSDNGQSATKDGGALAHLSADARVNKDESDTHIASSLVQIPVPRAFAGKTFGDMFTHLVATEDIVAIGLYRRRGIESVLPYVVAGPAIDTTLVKDDMVFVLGQPAALEREKASRAKVRAL